mgnify:CR=1 FL=1
MLRSLSASDKAVGKSYEGDAEVDFRKQSTFVKGRSIIDNVMESFETIHSMRQRQIGKSGEVVVKIDILKAYDRVE